MGILHALLVRKRPCYCRSRTLRRPVFAARVFPHMLGHRFKRTPAISRIRRRRSAARATSNPGNIAADRNARLVRSVSRSGTTRAAQPGITSAQFPTRPTDVARVYARRSSISAALHPGHSPSHRSNRSSPAVDALRIYVDPRNAGLFSVAAKAARPPSCPFHCSPQVSRQGPQFENASVRCRKVSYALQNSCDPRNPAGRLGRRTSSGLPDRVRQKCPIAPMSTRFELAISARRIRVRTKIPTVWIAPAAFRPPPATLATRR